MSVHTSAIFKRDDRFAALDAARDAAKRAGFSVGYFQDHAPCGLVFGTAKVLKWGDLARDDHRKLHGQLWASKNGRATIMLHADAPPEAVAAYEQILDACDEGWPILEPRKALQHALLILLPALAIITGVMAISP